MKHLIIVGVGGLAREVYWHAQNSFGYMSEWDIKGFLDGDVKLKDKEYEKLPDCLLGDVNNYEIEDDDVFICAIAVPRVREKLVIELQNRGAVFINLIHKTAQISPNSQMGIGNIICCFALLSCDCRIGNHVIMNCRSGVGHDASIGDYSSLMGNVSILGGVKVGRSTFWGEGACALPNSKIEDEAFITIRSVVFKKVKKGMKVFGNPAMPI